MPIVNPTLEHLAAFSRGTPDDAPIVMVNLLKFRERADYDDGGAAGISGRKAYGNYSKAVMPLVLEVGGRPLWMGDVRAGVIVPEGEAWDEVVLVHYPSRRAFLKMVNSDAYRAVLHHRTAALVDSRLIETKSVWLPTWLLRAASRLVRAKALVFPNVT
jgi:uncharacterized protein (DUF1330 family)